MSLADFGSYNWSCVGAIGAGPIGHETHNFGEETLPRKLTQIDLKTTLIWETNMLPLENDQMNSICSKGHNPM